MLRPYRRSFIALLLGIHAAITLCGPALHGLSGVRHGFASETAASVQTPAEPRDDGAPSASDGSDHGGDDCPICSYFAQAQLAPEAGPAAPSGPAVLVEGPPSHTLAIAKPSLPSNPRAPPRVALAQA